MHIRLGTRGQVTIPVAIRRKLGIKKGTRIQFDSDENALRIVVTPITPEHVRQVKGRFKGSGAMQTLLDEKRRERDL